MTSPEEVPIGVSPGDVLAGKYRVERVLGAGGMGVVVAAHHLQLDEKVALKFLLPAALDNPEAVSRFVREARAAVKIKSEHVARVSDVGQLANGSPYMVMEYLEGGDLAAWLRQRGPMPVEQAVDFVLQAAEAIAEAHALGIVHRDLKPANLFCVLRADGRLAIKVLDFGISKVTRPGAHGHDMTSTAAIVGSPNYMSPEQLQSSKGVDARTDIWSLGVILFELLTARVPFEAEAVTELVIKIAIEPAPPVTGLRGDVPPGLAQVIATCLEKDRERRFASVSELAIALRDYAPRHARVSVERILGTLRAAGISAVVLPPSGEHAAAGSMVAGVGAPMPPTMATWGTTGSNRGSLRPGGRAAALWTGIAVAAVVTAIGAGVVVKLVSPRATRPAAVAPASAVYVTSATASTPVAVAAEAGPVAVAVDDVPSASARSASTTAPSGLGAPPRKAPVTAARLPAPALTAAAAAPAPAKATAATAPSCDPPYTLDEQGSKHFKPECYLNK